ncbi:EF-hand domain-containing protein [Nonomuraea typhae]|uniref:EF-hand domain-containing protein n=1 Tax=Nonomuraea typhae TaxID=2603600 RepID=UPI0012F9496E|nr:EF-hand domain-containing protein [Nonomuraea typhae]
MAPPGVREPLERDAFELFDSNGDGRLSAEEILLGLALMHPVSGEDVDFLITLAGSDDDGLVSRKGFDRLRERAPAPFYGELLHTRFAARIDARSLRQWLAFRGLDFPRAQIVAFLRNINPTGRPVLPRPLYESFVRAYRAC